MLRATLETLALAVPLVLTPPNALSAEQYMAPHTQKPPIYAQLSYGNEDLNTILNQAETLSTTRPHYAIALYRRVMAERGPLAEKAVEGVMEIYNKKLQRLSYNKKLQRLSYNKKLQRLSFKDYDKWEVENALSFFDEVINKHSKYAPEAYLKSGEMLCDLLFSVPERVPEAMERLEEAYKRGDNTIKAKARFKQGWTENLIAGVVGHFFERDTYQVLVNQYNDMNRVVRRLREVIKLAPKSNEAQMARNLLEVLEIPSIWKNK